MSTSQPFDQSMVPQESARRTLPSPTILMRRPSSTLVSRPSSLIPLTRTTFRSVGKTLTRMRGARAAPDKQASVAPCASARGP